MQFAFVGFWVSLAESGLLPLDAKSTQVTDSGIGVRGVPRMYWNKFPSLRDADTPGSPITKVGLGIKSP